MKPYLKRPWYGFILNLLGRFTGFSGCLKCGDSWYWKESHCISFVEGGGMFPCCEECWRQMNPNLKKWYIWRLMRRWKKQAAAVGLADFNGIPWDTVFKLATSVIDGETVER